jgi:hypothetical protein
MATKSTKSTKRIEKAEESGETEESRAKPHSRKALICSQLSSAPPLSSAYEIPSSHF